MTSATILRSPQPTRVLPTQPAWHDALERLLHETVSVRRRSEERPQLAAELARLDTLQQFALASALAFRTTVAPFAEELATWLWQLALTVAAAGLPDTAQMLLGALPGVPADSPTRKHMLQLVIAEGRRPVVGRLAA